MNKINRVMSPDLKINSCSFMSDFPVKFIEPLKIYNSIPHLSLFY